MWQARRLSHVLNPSSKYVSGEVPGRPRATKNPVLVGPGLMLNEVVLPREQPAGPGLRRPRPPSVPHRQRRRCHRRSRRTGTDRAAATARTVQTGFAAGTGTARGTSATTLDTDTGSGSRASSD